MAFAQSQGMLVPNQAALHMAQQSQMAAHPVLSTMPQMAAGNMFPFFPQCGINPLLLQRNLANAQIPPQSRPTLASSQATTSPPRSPASLSAHSTEDGRESSRTPSPNSNRPQSTPTSSSKLVPQPDSPSGSSVNTIFPRRKAGQHARLNSKPVVLNETTLRKLFALPLHEAATTLGISATAMKSACRKLGIKKWPYRTVQSTKTAAARRAFTGGPRSSPTASTMTAAQLLAEGDASAGSAQGSDCLSKDAQLLTETMRLFRGRAAMDSESNDSEDEKETKEGLEQPKSSLAMLLN